MQRLLRLAREGALGHAYLFFGPPQVGKARAAMMLASFLECGNENPGTRPLTDALIVQPGDRGVIGIDAVREVKQFLAAKPFLGPRRTAIVDRAELLTPEAQNALLKVTEEPPLSALLILIAPDPEALWPTLRSRLQALYFAPVSTEEVAAWLVAQGAKPKEAETIAGKAQGRPGFAQELWTGAGAERRALAERFFKTSPADRKEFLKELTEPEDFDFAAFLDSLIAYLATAPQRNGALWHAVLELRRMQEATNLSPRLQLMNLWTLT